jgi:hypothetical protein
MDILERLARSGGTKVAERARNALKLNFNFKP